MECVVIPLACAFSTNVALTEPEAPHPHPLATPDLKSAFTDSLRKAQASASESSAVSTQGGSHPSSTPSQQAKGGNAQVYQNFWEAPERYWKHDLNDWEVELVSVRIRILSRPSSRLTSKLHRREARRDSPRAHGLLFYM